MRAGSFRSVHVDGWPRQNDPTGKSLLIVGIRVKPKNQKYFCLPERKSGAYLWPSRPTQRASAVVTDVGRVAVDAGLRLDDGVDERTAKPCGPGARCRRQAVGEA